MCGIAGYIGQSKNPKLSYELLTHLFDHLETRGFDASGVWGTEPGEDGRVIYHKEPIRSSEFIKKDFWIKLKKMKTNLMLVHSRWKSRGGGTADNNANNHPFVSADKRIGMIHNGTLDEFRYLKERYQILSDTDSEVLLRMFEHGMDEEDSVESRLKGIKDIWSLISNGAMAVAFGERVDDERYLYLFRNEQRPLWLADLRGLLGQVFFFSSPEIWYRAISGSSSLKKVCSGTHNLIEVPTSQIWCFKVDSEVPMVMCNDQILKYEVEVSTTGKTWNAGNKRTIKKPKVELSIVSQLDDDENVLGETTKEKPKGNFQPEGIHGWKKTENGWTKDEEYEAALDEALERISDDSEGNDDDTVDDFSAVEAGDLSVFEPPADGYLDHESICKQIIDLTNSIETMTTNSAMEGNFSPNDYQEVLESLEQTRVDLEGTLRIIGGQ